MQELRVDGFLSSVQAHLFYSVHSGLTLVQFGISILSHRDSEYPGATLTVLRVHSLPVPSKDS